MHVVLLFPELRRHDRSRWRGSSVLEYRLIMAVVHGWARCSLPCISCVTWCCTEMSDGSCRGDEQIDWKRSGSKKIAQVPMAITHRNSDSRVVQDFQLCQGNINFRREGESPSNCLEAINPCHFSRRVPVKKSLLELNLLIFWISKPPPLTITNLILLFLRVTDPQPTLTPTN